MIYAQGRAFRICHHSPCTSSTKHFRTHKNITLTITLTIIVNHHFSINSSISTISHKLIFFFASYILTLCGKFDLFLGVFWESLFFVDVFLEVFLGVFLTRLFSSLVHPSRGEGRGRPGGACPPSRRERRRCDEQRRDQPHLDGGSLRFCPEGLL